MLNRVRKNLIVIALGLCLTLPTLAVDSTISYITINNLAYQDVEIVITNDSKILVPFKQLATIFDIKYSANRVDKMIGFKTLDGKDGVVNQRGVFVADEAVSDCKPYFLQQGMMDGVFNEAYIDSKTAEKIFGVKLEADFETLTISAEVERDIPLLANNNILNIDDKTPRAHQDIAIPKKSGKITLNNIGLRTHMLNDNMLIRGTNFRTNNNTFAGTTQASISGKLMSGKYRVEATEFHYRSEAFMFGGLTGTYMNSFKPKNSDKKYYYELGRVKGRTDVDSQIGTNIFGAQIWDYNYDREKPEEIDGYVKPTSLVRLTVNDLEPMLISTYAGYYSLKDVQLPNPVKRIKLEEVNEDGTVELIKDERYQIYGDRPFAREDRGSVYAGVWGYQNRFFRDGANIYRGNNKKVTAGADWQYGIKDNVTFESKLTGDKIYEKTNTNLIYRVPTNDALLVTGTQKSVNYLEGATSLNSVEWQSKTNPNIKARGTAGVSVAHDIREHDTHAGYIVKGTGEYEKDLSKFSWKIFKPKKIKAKIEAFNTSPDFYIASSDSTSKNDRTGGKVSGGFSFNQTGVNGGYSKYYSNLNSRYNGGTLEFDEATLNASTKIPKVANLRFSSHFRKGENDLGRNKNYYYDANATREFNNWVKVQGGQRVSYYDTKFDNPDSLSRNYRSEHSDIYTQIDVPIPNNLGKFHLGHNFVRYDTLTYKNGYNMFRFGYTFPTWKRLTLGLGWGLRYYGQGGNDLNVNLAYRSKSGQTMSVGYQYSQHGGYFIDNMFTPTTNRHSVNFIFNDAFQIFNHGLRSIGYEDLDKGIFEAIAFVDIDKDGKFNKKVDIPVSNVPLITSWSGETCITNKRGRVASSSLNKGIYTVSLDMNTLPMTVAPVNNDLISKKIRIDGGQTTKLEIPLTSTVGSVSGELKITDDFNRNLKITDFIVVLLDENGEEVNYSTVDSSGYFYFSGLAPGKYTLQLDEKFVNAYGLEDIVNRSSREIFIPYDYENVIDVTNQNLEYKTLSL